MQKITDIVEAATKALVMLDVVILEDLKEDVFRLDMSEEDKYAYIYMLNGMLNACEQQKKGA